MRLSQCVTLLLCNVHVAQSVVRELNMAELNVLDRFDIKMRVTSSSPLDRVAVFQYHFLEVRESGTICCILRQSNVALIGELSIPTSVELAWFGDVLQVRYKKHSWLEPPGLFLLYRDLDMAIHYMHRVLHSEGWLITEVVPHISVGATVQDWIYRSTVALLTVRSSTRTMKTSHDRKKKLCTVHKSSQQRASDAFLERSCIPKKSNWKYELNGRRAEAELPTKESQNVCV